MRPQIIKNVPALVAVSFTFTGEVSTKGGGRGINELAVPSVTRVADNEGKVSFPRFGQPHINPLAGTDSTSKHPDERQTEHLTQYLENQVASYNKKAKFWDTVLKVSFASALPLAALSGYCFLAWRRSIRKLGELEANLKAKKNQNSL